ncbi:hypothetical protein HGRIS_010142 [Hohenbuehelia grisea]|uniref:F-box domain-containing protein n=1 Tax=Hohenbuehelia grisea TaxID=104357 RepID=A0ABR3J3C2_9AGAR
MSSSLNVFLERTPMASSSSPATSDIQALDAKIQDVFASITAQQQYLTRLRSERNAIVPISALPAELLVDIFQYLTEMELSDCDGKWSRHQLYLVPATHVCRSWRNIALGYPFLWTTFLLYMPIHARWTTEYLVRSKAAPLTLLYHGPPFAGYTRSLDSCAWDTMCAILRLPGKTKSLSISIDDPFAIRRILNRLEHADVSSHLESLSIELTTSALHELIVSEPAKIIVSAPRLQTLILRGLGVKCEAALAHSAKTLTKLHIARSTKQGTYIEALSALRLLPHLKELSLEHCISDTPLPPSVDLVHLPELTSINVATKHFSVSHIFEFLHFPSTTRTHLSLVGLSRIDRDAIARDALSVSGITAILSRLHCDKAPSKTYHLVVEFDDHIHLKIFTSLPQPTLLCDLLLDRALNCDSPFITLQSHGSFYAGQQARVAICDALPRKHIASLEVACYSIWRMSHWWRLLGQLDGVTRVNVGSRSLCELMESPNPLMHPCRQDAESSTSPERGIDEFPALTTLEVDDWHPHEGGSVPRVTDFMGWLETRIRKKLPIQTLSFTDHGLLAEEITQIQKLVPSLCVDDSGV